MPRILSALIIVSVLTTAISCERRKWENQYDPESTTYPAMEYFVFDSYYYYQGYYWLDFRLKFNTVTVRNYVLDLRLLYNGVEVGNEPVTIETGFIGYYLGYPSPYPFPDGNYEMVLNYGGELYAKASHYIGLAQEPLRSPPVRAGFYFGIRRLDRR